MKLVLAFIAVCCAFLLWFAWMILGTLDEILSYLLRIDNKRLSETGDEDDD